MLNKTTAAPENRRPWRWYRVGAPEEHLSGSVLLRSSTRVGAPEEPGSVLLRSWLLRSRVGDSQERPSPTYPLLGSRLPQRPGHTGTHRGLGQAGQGHEELPPTPPLRRQPRRTAMANRSPGDRTQARRHRTQPRESENANTGRTPTEGSRPASNAPLLPTPCPPSPATSSPTQANETTKGRTRPQPSRKSSNLPTPRIPPDPPDEPRPSILVILPPTTTTAPPGPGILIILPPATSTGPAQSVPRVQKRCEGPTALPQRPHRRLDLV